MLYMWFTYIPQRKLLSFRNATVVTWYWNWDGLAKIQNGGDGTEEKKTGEIFYFQGLKLSKFVS
jgi:hypothetical protein